MTARTLVCMKWGGLFGAEYVNVLASAAVRHLAEPCRIVCLTDDDAGLGPGIEAHPLPDLGLTLADRARPGAWQKIGLYLRDVAGLEGRCLFIDLDMMICGPLDRFFELPAPFVMYDTGPGVRRRPRPGPPEPATGIFAFDAGAEAQIAAAFEADPEGAMTRFRNEQDFVAAHVRAYAFWPPGWVVSFKRHLCQPIGRDLVLPPDPPPPGASVVAFHGDPRPADLIRPGRHRWRVLPHWGRGQVGWLADYWRSNGGRVPDA